MSHNLNSVGIGRQRKLKSSALIFVTLAVGSTTVFAQKGGLNTSRLEEVLVTAQKTSQSAQDVPISISVMDGDTLRNMALNTVADIAAYTPNVQVTENYRAIRGVGSTIGNEGSENSVSYYVDGMFQKGKYILVPAFLDVDRVEVLRGPQGSLYGKNAIAGVISVHTRNPSDEWEGFASYTGNADGDATLFQGAVGGPIIEGFLNARLAFLKEDRQGYMENTGYNENTENGEFALGADTQVARLKLEIPDVNKWNVLLSYTAMESLSGGTGNQIFEAGPGLEQEFQRYDPEFTFGRDYKYSTSNDERTRLDASQSYLRLSYGEEWNFTLAGGYSYQNVAGGLDVDFSPAPVVWGESDPLEGSIVQWEAQVSSPLMEGFAGLSSLFGTSLGTSEFIVGALALRNWRYARTDIYLDAVPFLQVSAGALMNSILPGGNLIDLTELEPLLPLGLEQVQRNVRTRIESQSLFGQYIWHLRDDLHITLGARYGREDRSARWRLEFVGDVPPIIFPAINWSEYEEQREFKDSEFSPKASVTYDFSENINAYITYAKGFKSGGINDGSQNGAEETLYYAPEKAVTWDIGSKMYLLDRRLQLNIALFHTKYQDLQTEYVNEASEFVVINAANAILKGAEVDFNWLATEWQSFRGGIGYLHGRYESFPQGPCQKGASSSACDLAGEPTLRETPWTANLTSITRFALPYFDNLGGLVSVSAVYVHDTFLAADNDPDQLQEAYVRWDARLGISTLDQTWSLTLEGKNLTDEYYLTAADDSGLFDYSWGVAGRPREVSLKLQYNY